MRSVCAAIGAVLVLIAATAALAQQPASTPAPGQTTSPTQAPTAPPPAVGQATPAQPAAPAQAPQPRTFTAPVGLLFNTVRADRVEDFERAMGYLQAALAASTNDGSTW